jgi:hypothetical protein
MPTTLTAGRRASAAMLAGLTAVWGCGRDTIAGPDARLAALASAQSAPSVPLAPTDPPATLTGEFLSGRGNFRQIGDCRTDDDVRIIYTVRGTAVGPYPGPFVETGLVRLRFAFEPGFGRLGQGAPTGPLLEAAFAIFSPAALVTGTKSLFILDAGSALCTAEGGVDFSGFFGFGYVLIGTYSATIRTRRGDFHDEGRTSAHLFGQSASLVINEQFISRLGSPVPVARPEHPDDDRD